MKLNELTSSGYAKAYRKGRGVGSGNGKTAGRGHKGQNARSGGGVRPGFEGGQMPLYRRLPKRGFNNTRFAFSYIEINVSDLENFPDGTTVDSALLADSGILSVAKVNDGIKVLGNGVLTKKLVVKAKKFSASAKEKIEKAGGSALEV
jgi:large subunit ribosomal protein L15